MGSVDIVAHQFARGHIVALLRGVRAEGALRMRRTREGESDHLPSLREVGGKRGSAPGFSQVPERERSTPVVTRGAFGASGDEWQRVRGSVTDAPPALRRAIAARHSRSHCHAA